MVNTGRKRREQIVEAKSEKRGSNQGSGEGNYNGPRKKTPIYSWPKKRPYVYESEDEYKSGDSDEQQNTGICGPRE